MRFLPIQRFTIVSPLPPEELAERFARHVGKSAYLNLKRSSGYRLCGKVNESRFRIAPVALGDLRAFTTAYGELEDIGNGTAVQVTLTIHPYQFGGLGIAWLLSICLAWFDRIFLFALPFVVLLTAAAYLWLYSIQRKPFRELVEQTIESCASVVGQTATR